MKDYETYKGPPCPKCKKPMTTKRRKVPPSNCTTFYFSQWDVCQDCHHMQHYERFKVYPEIKPTSILVKRKIHHYTIDSVIETMELLLEDMKKIRAENSHIISDDELPWDE
jgi:type II secretory ATPase GspE/PulE/Tfp pilus assembly ATPase PilB-like protein